jgi:hypothetical protein
MIMDSMGNELPILVYLDTGHILAIVLRTQVIKLGRVPGLAPEHAAADEIVPSWGLKARA